MKKIFSLLALIIFTNISAYNYLTVGDPRTSWWTQTGTIEEATFSVKPKGIYTEVGMYLTFSARNTSFTTSDSLEIVYYFDLPDNAIVTDSWLWIGDTIARAKIMDRWTATSVYEGIVQRRQDPSILTKQSSTQYQLRVFPMNGLANRKVKITYLIPTQWATTNVTTKLPLNILTASYNQLPFANIITWTNSDWQNPAIINVAGTQFNQFTSVEFGNHWVAQVPYSNYNSNPTLRFNSPMVNGVYISKYNEPGENYYQMAILPSSFLPPLPPKKIAFLVDYDISKTTYTQSAILNSLKQSLHSQLNPQDSFNLIFSGFIINRISNVWLPADSTTIENTFSSLLNPMSNYSTLAPLIANAIDFINLHGNDGRILLVSSSDGYGSSAAANNLINDILPIMNPDIPFYICDIQNQNVTYNYINSTYYYGNQYFYTTLVNITGGAYYKTNSYYYYTPSYTLDEILQFNFDEISGIINSFNLYTSVSGGYCYGRYNLDANSSTVYINRPILQVGKYIGSLPFNISIAGDYNGNIFNTNINYASTSFALGDSAIKAMWGGNYVKDLENQTNQTNTIINNIISKSLSTRVLSRYTAFLCLEDSTYYCDVCQDESVLVGVEEQDSLQMDMIAAPNPFNDFVKITLTKNASTDYENAEYSIFNVLGEKVYQFNYSDVNKGETLEFRWNGIDTNGNNLNAGIYLFVVKTDKGVKTLKLIKS